MYKQTATITWSNAELKAGTAKTVLAAQGAGTIVIPHSVILKMNYGGTNVFTNAPNVSCDWSSGLEHFTTGPGAGFWQAASNQIDVFLIGGSGIDSYTNVENDPVTLELAAALTGNAANNNTVSIVFEYSIVTI